MQRSTKRLILLLIALPVTVLLFGVIYMELMNYAEDAPRDFWTSIEWAAETLTTTGYGTDANWKSPLMVGFVIIVQFFGVFLIWLLFPIYIIPFFEERFEARLPHTLPAPRGEHYILIYRYNQSVSTLIDELARHERRTVIIEEDNATARHLHDQGLEVVHLRHPLDELNFDDIGHAQAIVANGSDHENASLLLIARDLKFGGHIYARVDDPLHRQPLTTWGVTAIYTPVHELAEALASRASRRIRSTIQGVQQLGAHLGVAELRIHQSSPLVGHTLEHIKLRKRHGVTVLGKWRDGRFVPKPLADSPLAQGDIVIIAGLQDSLESLGRLAIPLTHTGPIIIAGYGDVGQKVQQLLTDAGEATVVIDQLPMEGVDIVGNVLDRDILERRADVKNARAVVLAPSLDSACLFAAMVVREVAPDVPLVARANRPQAVSRLYRIGVDFALSMGQVAGQRLARHILGEEYVSLEHNLKLISVDATGLVGQHPLQAGVHERTACQIVAIEHGDELIVEFGEDFRVADTDKIFLAGSQRGLDAYSSLFPSRAAKPD